MAKNEKDAASPRWIETKVKRPKLGRGVAAWYGPNSGATVVTRYEDGRYFDDCGGDCGVPKRWARIPRLDRKVYATTPERERRGRAWTMTAASRPPVGATVCGMTGDDRSVVARTEFGWAYADDPTWMVPEPEWWTPLPPVPGRIRPSQGGDRRKKGRTKCS